MSNANPTDSSNEFERSFAELLLVRSTLHSTLHFRVNAIIILLCTYLVLSLTWVSVKDTSLKLGPQSCAIVLNSGVYLHGYRYGKLIDKNAVVVRFNMAPTKGYEHLVGVKTTYMWTHRAHYQAFKNRMDTPEYASTKLIVGPYKSDHEHLNRSGIPRTRYILPEPKYLAERCKSDWLAKSLVDQFPNKTCTSGVHAVTYFLKLCKHVNVYGLYLGDMCDIPIHYYEERRCNNVNIKKPNPRHNYTYEHEMLALYSEHIPALKLFPDKSVLMLRKQGTPSV